MKIDKRLAERIVLDTETTRYNGWVNDISWLVYNKYGIVLEKRYLIKEAFDNDVPFNKEKENYYYNLLESGEVPLVSIDLAIQDLLNDIYSFNADVYAYNSSFDFEHINKTLEDFESELFLDKDFIDIWALAYTTIIEKQNYAKAVYENGWLTEKGNPKMSAETVYRYISGNKDFNENHTALSDVRIEKAILERALKPHVSRNYKTPSWVQFKKYCQSLGYGV